MTKKKKNLTVLLVQYHCLASVTGVLTWCAEQVPRYNCAFKRPRHLARNMMLIIINVIITTTTANDAAAAATTTITNTKL